MPVIAANPVAAAANKPRLCPFCAEFVPAGFAVICVHGYTVEPQGSRAYHIHLHPWSLPAMGLDPKILGAAQDLMADAVPR